MVNGMTVKRNGRLSGSPMNSDYITSEEVRINKKENLLIILVMIF